MRAAGSSAGGRIAGWPWSCRYLRYTKVRLHFGMHSFVHVALRGRAGMRRTVTIVSSAMSSGNSDFGRFCQSFLGTPGSSFRWLRGGLSAMRRGCAEGAEKCCKMRRRCCISVFWAPDQREKGGKGGENGAKKMQQWGCNTVMQKSSKKGGDGGVAGPGVRVDFGRKIVAELQ